MIVPSAEARKTAESNEALKLLIADTIERQIAAYPKSSAFDVLLSLMKNLQLKTAN